MVSFRFDIVAIAILETKSSNDVFKNFYCFQEDKKYIEKEPFNKTKNIDAQPISCYKFLKKSSSRNLRFSKLF